MSDTHPPAGDGKKTISEKVWDFFGSSISVLIGVVLTLMVASVLLSLAFGQLQSLVSVIVDSATDLPRLITRLMNWMSSVLTAMFAGLIRILFWVLPAIIGAYFLRKYLREVKAKTAAPAAGHAVAAPAAPAAGGHPPAAGGAPHP